MSIDPFVAYRAATEDLALFAGDDRALFTVTGRSPAQMLNGVLAGTMPPVPSEVESGVFEGRATYHAVLTPKGKMVSDLRATLLGEEDGPGFLLDVPDAGRADLMAHFATFLPPRFAKVTEVTAGAEIDGGGDGGAASGDDQPSAPSRRSCLTVVGPEAAAALSKLALGLRVDASWLEAAEEGAWRCVGDPTGALLAARTKDVRPPAWTVYGPADAVEALRTALLDEGAVEGDAETWDTLRVEAGRPAFGSDMDDGTLAPEAGIVDRAIDHAKGCYTGQEVIVRIRDRGHVNWELRRLDFGDGPAPEPGAELTGTDGSDKVVARITSVVRSPRAGGALALGYVRREVDEVAFGDRAIPVPTGLPEPIE